MILAAFNETLNKIVSCSPKLNVTKTQILPINYTPPQVIQQAYKFKWKVKTIIHLGVIISRNFTKLYKINCGTLNQEIQKDMKRWLAPTLDFQDRNHKAECVTENFIFVSVITNRNSHITIQRMK